MIASRKPKQDARTAVARDEIARTGVCPAYCDVAPSYRNPAVNHSYGSLASYRNPSVGADGSHSGSISSDVVTCYHRRRSKDDNSRTTVAGDDISRGRINSTDY